MANNWVLVANASEARLFSAEKIGDTMHCLKEFSHPESREKGSNLASDRPGHNQSKGAGHGSMVEQTNPKDYEAERFAGELAEELEKGRTTNAFRHLILVATPRFYGLLNTRLSDQAKAMIKGNIQKDFTDCHERDLPARLKENMV
jgi:protein required for attachment to host cells